MSIRVVRVFIQLREVLATDKDLAHEVGRLQAKQKDHSALFSIVVSDIQNLEEFKRLKAPPQSLPSTRTRLRDMWTCVLLQNAFTPPRSQR
jgi:hypothetical protein